MKHATHTLKTWPVHFQRTWDGEKPFEVRLDDRGYQKGDLVILREWERDLKCGCEGGCKDDCLKYSGREMRARIGCVMASTPSRGSTRGFVGNGYVVLGLCDITKRDDRDLALLNRIAEANG